MPKKNPNFSFLLELPWLQSVYTKLFIKIKKIHIRDIEKEEVVSQILCLTTFSKSTQFQTSKKDKAFTYKSSIEDDTKNKIEESSFEKESDKEFFNQDFQKVQVMTLKVE